MKTQLYNIRYLYIMEAPNRNLAAAHQCHYVITKAGRIYKLRQPQPPEGAIVVAFLVPSYRVVQQKKALLVLWERLAREHPTLRPLTPFDTLFNPLALKG